MALPAQKIIDKKAGFRTTVKDQSGAGKTKIGEVLRREGHILNTQLEEALAIQKKSGQRLGSILIKLGYIEDSTILNVLSRIHNFPSVDIKKDPPNPEIFKTIPFDIVKKYCALPLRLTGKTLQITMAEPTDTSAVEELQSEMKMVLSVCVSTENDIFDAYKKYYKISDEEFSKLTGADDQIDEEEDDVTSIDDFGTLASEAAEDMAIESDGGREAEEFSASDAPIIKLVNGILIKAVKDGVSDIHIEPYEKSLQVRYRLDGSLYKSMNLPLSIKNALNSRVKILSSLDITERRVPQDGRIKMRIGKNKVVDFRVSTLPTLFGESIVLRILDKDSLNVDLTKLGFESNVYATLKRCLNRPQGLLLVTGPTGSGKTVTLYSALNSLNSEDTKILTAEDPVEFNFRGINQVNVHQEVGMTFAAALKAFLRQDPDIIMVGEIRDMETAEIAIKAAMTGHLVFSTLHTNDCAATIGRLVDIGIPPYMLASAITMVQSQRLGRRLCKECKVEVPLPDAKELLAIGFTEDQLKNLKLYGPKGCPVCRGGGYKGRVGFFELMEITDEVAKAISAEVPEDQLRKVAIQEGMIPLRNAAILKAIQGVTSLDEVLKKTVITEESLPAYLVNPDMERYEDGDVIIRQGNTDIDFFQLIQGALMVVKDGKKIAEITEPNEYFGEMSAISGVARSASILSKGRSAIKRFPGDKIMEIIEKHPQVAKHFFKTLVTRLGQANDIIVKLAESRGR
ncbi:MAG: type IV-A pilus assembly ATPase PilB [Proteobacteria bacterium]|nr:type IV-A pilus assembly ATPase PilB [Pseudomonadota bacterium]MBU4295645.1 type IV-A pilus assembly ATPase PilB [Pseudomonadota bacterium]MCG2746836.1 type IV-A pilus assembly ATPase PilB [Desulfobulbaceae bacterium]